MKGVFECPRSSLTASPIPNTARSTARRVPAGNGCTAPFRICAGPGNLSVSGNIRSAKRTRQSCSTIHTGYSFIPGPQGCPHEPERLLVFPWGRPGCVRLRVPGACRILCLCPMERAMMQHLPIGPAPIFRRCGDCDGFLPYAITENKAVSIANCLRTGLKVCNCDTADLCPVFTRGMYV